MAFSDRPRKQLQRTGMPPRKEYMQRSTPKVWIDGRPVQGIITKMPDEGSVRWYFNQLDKYTSWIVRFNERKCFCCGYRGRLECGHIFGRAMKNTRWDIHPTGNCHAQCPRCNGLHNRDRNLYVLKFVGVYGADAFATLRDRAFTDHKYDIPELEELLVKYRAEVARLEDIEIYGQYYADEYEVV